ncbi:MAG: uroporphyrinogen-III synthase [Rhodospirillales bacterium]
MIMRVLVTRPGEDGTALAKILIAHGFETIIEPLLTIKQTKGPALELSNTQALLLSSANGVRALAQRTDRRNIPIYAVGDATATTAKGIGFTQVHSAVGNVESLVDLVIKMLKPTKGPLIHIAGSAVAGNLIKLIKAAGFECRREILYEAIAERSLMASSIAAIKDNRIDVVMLYSPRSAEIFVKLIRKARLVRSCQKVIALCLSTAVADKIGELNWYDIRVAAKPNQDSLLEIITELSARESKNAASTEKSEKMLEQEAAQENSETESILGNTISHNVAPEQRRQGGATRTVLITLLIAVVFIGASLASQPLWLPTLQTFAPALFEASETEISITNLSGRLKALENVERVPNLKTLQQEKKHLQKKLDATLKRLDDLENSIGSVRKMIVAINTEPRAGATKTLELLSSRLQILENKNSTFRKNYQPGNQKAPERKMPAIVGGTQSSQASTLVLAIGQLRESVRAGRSFKSELAALNTLISEHDHIKIALKEALTELATIAETGAPSFQMLQSQFDKIAGGIVQVSLANASSGWFQSTLARLTESVKWRRTDNFSGGGVEAIVARVERALQFRDVKKAIKELSVIEKPASALTTAWLVRARSYIVAEKSLAELQSRAIAQMAKGQ